MNNPNGTISIRLGPWTGGRERGWNLSVTDERSRTQILDVDLTYEQFSMLLTGRYLDGIPAEWSAEKLGRRREGKSVLIPYPKALPHVSWDNERKPEHDEALAPYEVDGWVGCAADLTNFHRACENDDGVECRRVAFTRWIEETK
jgi:hypothetical protein